MNSRRIMDSQAAVIMSLYLKDGPFPVYCSLWSLVNQSNSNFIILLCIDGEINQETQRVIDYFYSKYEFMFVFYKPTNAGLASSLNFLIEHALSTFPNVDFFFRMDADDICFLQRIDKQLSFLSCNPSIDVIGGSCKEFGIYSKVIRKPENDDDIKSSIIRITPFIHPTVVFRKTVFEAGVRYPENTHLSEDLALWLSLAKKGYKFYNMQDIILYYRLNDKTLVRRMSFSKAISEVMARLDYIKSRKGFLAKDLFYIVGHFMIRLMPIRVSKLIYKLLR